MTWKIDIETRRAMEENSQLRRKLAEAEAEILRLRGEVVNRNKRALDGDISIKAFNYQYDRAEQAEADNKALREALEDIADPNKRRDRLDCTLIAEQALKRVGH